MRNLLYLEYALLYKFLLWSVLNVNEKWISEKDEKKVDSLNFTKESMNIFYALLHRLQACLVYLSPSNMDYNVAIAIAPINTSNQDKRSKRLWLIHGKTRDSAAYAEMIAAMQSGMTI